MGAAEELTGLKRLWQLGFGDEMEWIDQFFGSYSTAANRYATLVGGKPVAELHALRYSGGAYIYGVTTHPDYRRRGLGLRLMATALKELCRQGVPQAMLIAERPGLRQWYASMGFSLADSMVEVTGYTGENLGMDDDALNVPMLRVANAKAYIDTYRARHPEWQPRDIAVGDPLVAGNCGIYRANGRFEHASQLMQGAISPQELATQLPLQPGPHITIPPQ